MRRRLAIACVAVFASAMPAAAATCEEGVVAIEQISKLLELSELEQSNVESLIVKAKLEQEQGRQRNCKIILADAIRFFLIRAALE
jgi:hypothetical protein